MIKFTFTLLLLSAVSLVWFLLKTRERDSLSWWGLRSCLLFALICNVYMTYETWQLWAAMSPHLLFIRLGFVALTTAMLLMWHLLQKQRRAYKRNLFNLRLQKIFKDC